MIAPDVRFTEIDDRSATLAGVYGGWSADWTFPWMRVDAGVGYRFIGASNLLGEHLRGPSGSIVIQFAGR